MVPPKPTLPSLTMLLCFLLVFISAEAQMDCIPTWHHEISAPAHTESRDIRFLADGSSIVAGKALNGSNYDGLVMRLSASGNVLWSTTTGGAGDDELTGICVLNNGDLLLYGVTASYGHPAGKVWLVCMNGGGTVLWSRQLGSTTPGTDRPKAIQQFTDGDIIGTYTIDDSTATSDPVIFKMGLTGTMRWSKRFDKGGEEGFSSIAFNGNIVYAAGFYSTPLKNGVILQLNSNDGSLISAHRIYRQETYPEQVKAIEIFDGIISYGLWTTVSNNNHVTMVQTDLQGNLRSSFDNMSPGTNSKIFIRRTADQGFLLLDEDLYDYGSAVLRKFNRYGSLDWQRVMGQTWLRPITNGFYPTPDGGAITASYYQTQFGTNNINRILVTRVNNRGEVNSCLPDPGFSGWSPDTSFCKQSNLTWSGISDFSTGVHQLLANTGHLFTVTENRICDSTYCTDKTPLPADCNKTYRIEYTGPMSTIIMDAVSTTDGGRMAVGVLKDLGMLIKFNQNGDVAWSKRLGAAATQMHLNRIIRTSDGNLLATGLIYKSYNNTGTRSAPIVKLDNNGNILWSKNITYQYTSDQWIKDIVELPDGGFVVLLIEGYGGYADAYVVRFDATANIVWKKELLHPRHDPAYSSMAVTPSAVLVAALTDNGVGTDFFGVDRLDLATGNRVWSKTFTTMGNYGEQINRLFAVQDTAWLVVNQYPSSYYYSGLHSINILSIDPQGNVGKAFNFRYGSPIPTPVYGFAAQEANAHTVTMTPDHDFVFGNRIEDGSARFFSLCRVSRNGNILWTADYPAMKDYIVTNIHPQGKSILLMGGTRAPKPNDIQFMNGFMLKVDSSGHIKPPNSGTCDPVITGAGTSTPVITPLGILPGPDIIEDVVNPFAFNVTPSQVVSLEMPLDATLFCYEPASCGLVTLGQQGNGCSIGDTLVYFLQNAQSCGATASWQYDTAFFKTTLLSTDTLRLVPKQTGTSTIQVEMEGYCFLDTKSIQASVLVAASQVTLGQDTIVCEGGTVRIKAGPGYASYTWNNGSTGAELIVNAPGKYYVDVTDNCGGAGSDTIIVSRAGDLFSVTTPNPSKCNNDAIWLDAGGGFLNYQWSTQTGVEGQGNRISVNPSVTTKYYVAAEKWPGCQVKDSVLVNVLHSPAITLPTDTRICAGDSLLLDAGALFDSYSWNSGENTQQLMVRTAGKYIVIAEYANGCQSKDSFELGLHSLPMPALDKKQVLCTGSTRNLTPGQFASYLWNNGSTGSSLTVSTTGTWWVTVTDQHGCKGTDTAQIISIAPLPQDFLATEQEICQYGELKIIPLRSYTTYDWNDRSHGSTLTINQPGTYWLEATDQNSCKGRDTVKVVQKECLVGLYVPTAFTPNGDTRNDLFTPLLYGNATSLVFIVYNRWGQKVYETHTLRQGWDGKINGIAATPGTYVWQCRYKLDGQPEKLEKGIVQLIR